MDSAVQDLYNNFVRIRDTPKEKCIYYNRTHHNIILDNTYEGIPENLIINFVIWVVLLLLFAVLRKRAWNYGRIALVQKHEPTGKWTQLFYGTNEEIPFTEDETQSFSSVDSTLLHDRGFCSWISAIFRLRKEDILRKCGPDAVQYLSFQHHIIFFMMIMTCVSLAVVLPVNFQGDLEGDETKFGHTTFSNLDPNSPYLWIHVTLAILYLPLGICIMRRFSIKSKIQDVDSNLSRTLMITNVPKSSCSVADLKQHFHEAFPEMDVQDIQLAFNITRVSTLDKEREKMHNAKNYCDDYLRRTRERLEMRPYACGNLCSCCDIFGCPKVDAISYYTSEEERLTNEVDCARVLALRKPLGIIFVTFRSTQDSRRVFEDHKISCGCGHNVSNSSLSHQLRPDHWTVKYAPPSEDIFWENIAVPTKYWYLKAFLINSFLFLILFFLTTPAYVVNLIKTLHLTNKIEQINPFISQFLPTLILWTVAALLPVLVSYSNKFLSHWTRSEQNHAIMRKTFMFLLFMVLILPSLGLTSAQAFLEWTIYWKNETYRWECLFLPDKGAFFVNYVITSSFIGTSLELIRFPELFMYAIHLSLARSAAESASVRKAILWEFPFGVHYAWMLLIFAMTTVYSLSCPLITPFGLIYMGMKHMVDKHNLYFAYGPSKISPKIHATAISFVILSIVLLQLCFMAFSFLRKGFNDISIYALTGFILTLLFLFINICFNMFRGFSPIAYQGKKNGSTANSPHHLREHRFIPSVLDPARYSPTRQPPSQIVESDSLPSVVHKSYGTGGLGDTSPTSTVVSTDTIIEYQGINTNNA